MRDNFQSLQDQSLRDQLQGNQSFGLIGTIDRNAKTFGKRSKERGRKGKIEFFILIVFVLLFLDESKKQNQ